jgi:hypothetical protein
MLFFMNLNDPSENSFIFPSPLDDSPKNKKKKIPDEAPWMDSQFGD